MISQMAIGVCKKCKGKGHYAAHRKEDAYNKIYDRKIAGIKTDV
jgi:hypothetical protein